MLSTIHYKTDIDNSSIEEMKRTTSPTSAAEGKAFSFYSTVSFVSQSTTKLSIAKGILYSTLKNGLAVIKHACSPQAPHSDVRSGVTNIFWRRASNKTTSPTSAADGKAFSFYSTAFVSQSTTKL
eukprot:gene33749-41636_t